MAQTFAVRYFGAASGQVFRNLNGTFVTIGNTFTPSGGLPGDGVDPTRFNKPNLACQFGADIWCALGQGIHKLEPSTGNWITTNGIVSRGLLTPRMGSGIYIGRSPSGAPRAFSLGINGASNLLAHTIDLGGSWVAQAIGPNIATPATHGFHGQSIMYRGQWHGVIGSETVIYDPETNGYTTQQIGAVRSFEGTAFCRAGGRLFMARTTNGADAEHVNIYEFLGSWVQIIDGGSTSPVLPQVNSPDIVATQADWLAMHYDPAATANGGLVLHSYSNDGPGLRGWRVHTIDISTLAVTDVTNTVVPPGLRWNTAPDPGSPSDIHFHVEVDNQQLPSEFTHIWLLIADGSWVKYRWVNTATQMTNLGSGGDRGLALSNIANGGGEYIYDGSTTADPAFHVEEVQARVPISGGTRMFFTGYTFDETGGSPVIPSKNVEIRFTKTGQSAATLAAISAVAKVSGTGANPTLGTGAINGMTLDGTTIYSADWPAGTANQVLSGEFHIVMPRVII